MSGADPRRFLYSGELDPDDARRLAARHLSAHDDGELYLQYSLSESFGFDDGRLKTADYHSGSGFGLRGGALGPAFDTSSNFSVCAARSIAATLSSLAWLKAVISPDTPRRPKPDPL